MPPMYDWACKACGKVVTILRDFDNYKKPPEDACPECEGEDFEKHVNVSTTRYYFCD